jgi:hypothetical protein
MIRAHLSPAARLLGLAAAVTVLAACATLSVGSDRDPAASFSAYHSYVWMPPRTKPYESPNPLVVQRAHDAIQDALAAKGYQLVGDSAQADFVVDFTIGSRERMDVRSYPAPYAGPWIGVGPYWWGTPYWGNEVDVHQYREGEISIDIFDARTHRPVWHGWARKELTRQDLEHSSGSIRQAVDSVLAQFPPK